MNPSGKDQDEQWIIRIQQGDYDAFAEMTKRYYAGLFDFAYSYSHSPDTAQDLVQDVLTRVWINRNSWFPKGTAKAYLFRAVRNRSLNERRDRQQKRERPLSSAENIPVETPESIVRYKRLLSEYQAAVETLPDRRQLIFRLSRLYGLTYPEIAVMLNISLNTVRTQMTAALKQIRSFLAHHLE